MEIKRFVTFFHVTNCRQTEQFQGSGLVLFQKELQRSEYLFVDVKSSIIEQSIYDYWAIFNPPKRKKKIINCHSTPVD